MENNKVETNSLPVSSDAAKQSRSISRRRSTFQRQKQMTEVQMILPMSIRCKNCSSYIAKDTEFNSRKELFRDFKCLRAQIFMFWFNCPFCKTELSLKTNHRITLDDVVEVNRQMDVDGAAHDEPKCVKSKREGVGEIDDTCLKIKMLKL